MKSGSLRNRFTRTIFVVSVIFGLLAYFAFHLVTASIAHHLETNFGIKEALLEKSKISSLLQHDLSLSLKMADSPLLKQWAEDENNPLLHKYASEELESYRRNLDGKSLSYVISRSLHYYFAGPTTPDPFSRPSYTLKPNNPSDAWYFKAIQIHRPYEINVEGDSHLDLIKIWFNVLVKDSRNHVIGICGSGIDITSFIKHLVNSTDPGTETVLFAPDGTITGICNDHCLPLKHQDGGGAKLITVYDQIDTPAGRAELKSTLQALSSSGNEVRTLYLTIAGKRYLGAVSHLKGINWYNLVLVNPGYFVNTRDFLPILGVIIASMVALLLVVGFLLNRLILKPLAGLAESSEEIARGNFDIHLPVRSRDEIGSLTQSFNTMNRMVKDHMENLEAKVEERTSELNRSHEELAEINRKLTDSIRFARLIQGSILPEAPEIRQEAKQFFVLYRPQNIVGGDFYYFRKTQWGCFLALIDCTGHGVPGAFMTMTAKAVLDRVLDSHAHEEPATILREYNRLVKAALHRAKNGNSVDHGLEIGLCRWNPEQGELSFAGARIHLLRVTEGRVETITSDRQAIGYQRSDENFIYTNHTIPIAKDVPFYLTSDGILDQGGGTKGWGFGRKRLNELLAHISQHSAEEQKDAIEQALANYQGDSPQRDDITIIGFSL